MNYNKSNYGEVEFEGQEYQLTGSADFTSRLMTFQPFHEAGEGDEYYFEMSAPAIDKDGNKCTVYWEFKAIKGEEKELDEYDYDNVARVELN